MATHGRTRRPRKIEDQVELTTKELKCLQLRMAGYDYDTIAKNTGYKNRGAAYKAVMRALERTLKEPADSVRELEVKRLDELMTGVWLQAVNGDQKKIDSVIKIMDRRAKFLGLDKTELKVEHTGKVNLVWNTPPFLPQETPPKKHPK